MCHSVWGRGRVGFPACITGHMTRGSASRGVCLQGASASGVGGLHQGAGLHPGGRGVCIQEGWGSASGGGLSASRGYASWGSASGGSASGGSCIQGRLGRRPSIGYYGIQSTSRRYASYWNAHLFVMDLLHFPCHYRAR